MALTRQFSVSRGQIDDVAWQFLRSEFTGAIYADWPIERRLDAFLLHHGFRALHDDGTAYAAVLDRVMANMGVAIRMGLLPPSVGTGR